MPSKLYQIYSNIYRFFEYRDITPNEQKKDEYVFNNDILDNIYIELLCKNNRTNNDMIIYLFTISDKTLFQSNDFNKFFNKKIKKSEYSEIIIIIDEDIMTPHRHKKINALKNKINKLELYDYNLFATVKPEHILAPKHEILPSDDVDFLIEFYKLDKNNKHELPFIYINDPQIIWIGANRGDVVKITKRDEIAGEYMEYKLVI